MSQDKSLVKNAASEKQVKRAAEKEVTLRERQINDLIVVLNTRAGRNVFWRILGECKVFESIWESSAKIHYNSGKQDLGHWIMGEMGEASQKFIFTMMTENNKEKLNV